MSSKRKLPFSQQQKSKRMRIPRPFFRGRDQKYLDATYTAQALANTGSPTTLTNIAEGSDVGGREGRRIVPTAVVWNLYFYPAASVDRVTVRMSIIRVHGKYTGTPNDYINGLTAPHNLDKCSLIFDHYYNALSTTSVAATAGALNYTTPISKGKRKLRKVVTRFTGTAGTDDIDGAIVVIWRADTNNNALMNGNVRMFYSDPK